MVTVGKIIKMINKQESIKEAITKINIIAIYAPFK
jgi:hypothetical protein